MTHRLAISAQLPRIARPRRAASAASRTRKDGHPSPRSPKQSSMERGASTVSRSRRLRGYLTSSSAFLWLFVPALLAWWLVSVAATRELQSIDERDWPRRESVTLSAPPAVRLVQAAGWLLDWNHDVHVTASLSSFPARWRAAVLIKSLTYKWRDRFPFLRSPETIFLCRGTGEPNGGAVAWRPARGQPHDGCFQRWTRRALSIATGGTAS